MEANDSKALQLVKKLLDSGIDGIGPLCSAHDFAEEYLRDRNS